ncbi:phage holin family protein [Microbacterium radiodurans]|uniref:Phage holin family protein n=1 Tax=Microbacterium radiodurans TaxID=661398 RepID=A0A5J5ITB4_9MICO|nr:phage holin family protein [Microbacterium radiodurans]KAA9089197.1 phage holin family protein [Microbacterium radiodurans]
MSLIIRLIVNAFAIWIVTLIPALQVSVIAFPPGGDLQLVLTLLLIALIFGLVNAIVGTVVKLLAFPLYILTLGLISFVINGFLLWLTGWVTSGWDWGLRIGDFWLAVLAAIVIGLINWVAGMFFRPSADARAARRSRRHD